MSGSIEPEVLAAGGVVLRAGADGQDPDVLVVHRPAYDDWSLPKGKLDPGERWEEAALREVEEETGVVARLGVELSPTHYRDRKGRAKQVRWWVMPLLEQHDRTPDEEVDELRWLPVADVGRLLTYDGDRDLVDEALASLGHATVLVVRHTHAGERDQWNGDDARRPLTDAGHDQARALADLLGPWHVTSVISSPLVRCVQTVQPLADALGLDVVTDDRLAEGASVEQARAVVREAGPGTIACSHGDVIGALVGRLAAEGLPVVRQRWPKGSTWLLHRDADGRVVDADYLAPPS